MNYTHQNSYWSLLKAYKSEILVLSPTFIIVFIIAMLPLSWHKWLYNVFFTILFLSCTYLLSERKKIRILPVAIFICVLEWVALIFSLQLIQITSWMLQILFLSYVIFALVSNIAKEKHVNRKVLLEAINGFMIAGILSAIFLSIVNLINPESFSFSEEVLQMKSEGYSSFHYFIYYSFSSLTTISYGDMIPLTRVSRSVAIFIGVFGQLYIAIIIALLVGKLSSQIN